MGCNCHGAGIGTLVTAGAGISVTGSGSVANPYVVESNLLNSPLLTVRDSTTVNLTLFGSGSVDDPYTLSADTGAATALVNLSDVQSPAPDVGDAPVWIGPSIGGHFEFMPNGVYYCTTATRPDSAHRYPGLQIKEKDTGKRYEWDGTTWLDVTPAATPTTFAAANLTGTLLDATLPARIQQYGQLLTNVDMNTVTTTGWYRGSNLVHQPTADTQWYFYQVQSHGSGSTANISQTAHRYQGAQIYQRVRINTGVWSAWWEVVTTLNPSVLDAHNDARYTQGGNSLIQRGDVVFSPFWTADSGGYSKTLTLTFSKPFTTKPQIFLQPDTAAGQDQHWGVINRSATGFQFFYWRALNPQTNISAQWMAVGGA